MYHFSIDQSLYGTLLPPKSTRLFSQKSTVAAVLGAVGAIAGGAGPVAPAPGAKDAKPADVPRPVEVSPAVIFY